MERAFLENFGLEKDQIDKILDQASKDIGAKVNDIAALQSKYDAKVEELKSANTTIDNLKKANTDNQSLVEEIERYKKQAKEQEAQFKQTLIKNTATLELQKAGAIDPDLAVHLLDLGLGNVDKEGQVLGIAEQVEALKGDTTKSYLFRQAEQTTETPVDTGEVDRGGYSPQQGETVKSDVRWGYDAAQMEMQRTQQNTSTDDFWKNF